MVTVDDTSAEVARTSSPSGEVASAGPGAGGCNGGLTTGSTTATCGTGGTAGASSSSVGNGLAFFRLLWTFARSLAMRSCRSCIFSSRVRSTGRGATCAASGSGPATSAASRPGCRASRMGTSLGERFLLRPANLDARVLGSTSCEMIAAAPGGRAPSGSFRPTSTASDGRIGTRAAPTGSASTRTGTSGSIRSAATVIGRCSMGSRAEHR